MKLPTRDQLVKRRAIVIADAQMKLECADWHGCADACMDLREIDARITLFDELREDARRANPAEGWSTMPADTDLEGEILPDGAVVGKRVI